VIDLELLANHKGSSFGGLLQPPQPSTEQFENFLFEEILKLDETKTIWIEDESVALGKVFLPNSFWRTMGSSPVIELQVPQEIRIERLVDEYGHAPQEKFLEAMERIVKKLGGQNFKAAKEHYLAGNLFSTIEILLYYYDRAYHTGLEKKKHRIKLQVPWNGSNSSNFAKDLIKEVDLKKIDTSLVL
jgi:tRNA 2-selenouridine synthase